MTHSLSLSLSPFKNASRPRPRKTKNKEEKAQTQTTHPQRVRPDDRPRQRDRVSHCPELPELDEREAHHRVRVAADPAVDYLARAREERGELGFRDGAVDVADVDLV